MAGEISHNRLDRALRTHDWVAFARGYNGPNYAINSYDTRLAAAYQKYNIGPLPDLIIRAAQIYLTYLGYEPGTVDGIMGRFTRSALNEFQSKRGLPMTNDINDDVLLDLKQEVSHLPARFALPHPQRLRCFGNVHVLPYFGESRKLPESHFR